MALRRAAVCPRPPTIFSAGIFRLRLCWRQATPRPVAHRTASTPYFLRPGDSRRPVDFEVVDLQEGRTFSARRVTARQDGKILMEAMSSFKVADSAPAAGRLPTTHAGGFRSRIAAVGCAAPGGVRREHPAGGGRACAGSSVGSSTPEVAPPARALMWWRPDGEVPDDPVLTASLVTYLSAVTLTEPAYAARGGVGGSAQRDHSVWFHAPAALSDWLLYDGSSPSSAGSLALASGTMFNRNGELVCTVQARDVLPAEDHLRAHPPYESPMTLCCNTIRHSDVLTAIGGNEGREVTPAGLGYAAIRRLAPSAYTSTRG